MISAAPDASGRRAVPVSAECRIKPVAPVRRFDEGEIRAVRLEFWPVDIALPARHVDAVHRIALGRHAPEADRFGVAEARAVHCSGLGAQGRLLRERSRGGKGHLDARIGVRLLRRQRRLEARRFDGGNSGGFGSDGLKSWRLNGNRLRKRLSRERLDGFSCGDLLRRNSACGAISACGMGARTELVTSCEGRATSSASIWDDVLQPDRAMMREMPKAG